MTTKKLYITLPPELVDGQHFASVDFTIEGDRKLLIDSLAEWLSVAKVGDKVTLEIREMSPDDFMRLKSV